ncbi:hypothetical protein BJX70DRAFT_8257 [Aspergillus crustosus]
MLRQSLSIAALCLSSITASAEAFDAYSVPTLSVIPQPYPLNLSAAECAFSYSDCSNAHPSSFLKISLSTSHDTLLANNDPIFPPPIPMTFIARRSWEAGHDTVPIAYALDIEPIPHRDGAIIGDLYRLKLTLVDMQGRPATDSPVIIGLVRHANGDLEIVDLEESDIPRYHHRILHDWEDKGQSWWKMESWNSYYITFLHQTSKKTCDDTVRVTDGDTDVRVVSHCREHHRHPGWTKNRQYMRHIRPALAAGLLGVTASIVACVIGFVVGKVIVEVYCFFYRRGTVADDPEVGDEKAAMSEKVLLMEVYGRSDEDADADPAHAL